LNWRVVLICAIRGFPSLLKCRLPEPVLEADLAKSRVAGRNQRALAELGSEIPRVRVDDNLARVVACAEALADQVIETELSITAASSNDGEFDTSTTTAHPAGLLRVPLPVRVLTPVSGDPEQSTLHCQSIGETYESGAVRKGESRESALL
jgi:hypothetical protein